MLRELTYEETSIRGISHLPKAEQGVERGSETESTLLTTGFLGQCSLPRQAQFNEKKIKATKKKKKNRFLEISFSDFTVS